MLDPDLKSWWLRFWLQQVMLCDIIYITVIMRTCIITRTRTHKHYSFYIYTHYILYRWHKPKIVNGVGLYHMCLRYLNDEIMINHVYRIQIKSCADSHLSRKLSGPVRWPNRGPLWSVAQSCDIIFYVYMHQTRLRNPRMSSRQTKNHPPNYHDDKHTNPLSEIIRKGDFLATCLPFLLEGVAFMACEDAIAARRSWSSMWTSKPWLRPAPRCHPPRRPALPMLQRRSTSRRRGPVSLSYGGISG